MHRPLPTQHAQHLNHAASPSGPAANALLFGNFVVGCGVMVTTATLNDLSANLGVSVAAAGQLISLPAAAMMLGAPLAAMAVSAHDRRRLLTLALIWFSVGNLLCALAPGYLSLMLLRVATVLAAAVFTPQAGAAIGVMVAPEHRGRAVTHVFLGWSVASVLGMPLSGFIGDTAGWRWAFAGIGAMALVSAGWVWRAMPNGVRPAAVSAAQWRGVFRDAGLMALVMVTALSASGQFVLFAYLAPYYRQVLGATPAQVALLFLWFGLFGFLGNVWVSRHIDRLGPANVVAASLALMALSLALWPLARTVAVMALVCIPWALGCFASNSGQQARLVQAAPALAPALIAMNSSAMYLGQFAGAATGGVLVATSGVAWLSGAALAGLLAALAVSLWKPKPHART
jgi:predicted MFS family arabinose efflux permease